MARTLAYDLARKIEAARTYPGEDNVPCVRETRVTETAK